MKKSGGSKAHLYKPSCLVFQSPISLSLSAGERHWCPWGCMPPTAELCVPMARGLQGHDAVSPGPWAHSTSHLPACLLFPSSLPLPSFFSLSLSQFVSNRKPELCAAAPRAAPTPRGASAEVEETVSVWPSLGGDCREAGCHGTVRPGLPSQGAPVF